MNEIFIELCKIFNCTDGLNIRIKYNQNMTIIVDGSMEVKIEIRYYTERYIIRKIPGNSICNIRIYNNELDLSKYAYDTKNAIQELSDWIPEIKTYLRNEKLNELLQNT